jgi:hypothetical protein
LQVALALCGPIVNGAAIASSNEVDVTSLTVDELSDILDNMEAEVRLSSTQYITPCKLQNLNEG